MYLPPFNTIIVHRPSARIHIQQTSFFPSWHCLFWLRHSFPYQLSGEEYIPDIDIVSIAPGELPSPASTPPVLNSVPFIAEEILYPCKLQSSVVYLYAVRTYVCTYIVYAYFQKQTLNEVMTKPAAS